MPQSEADPYLYPGTIVLRNKQNIHDPGELEQFERLMTVQRSREGLPPVEISAEGYRAIHGHLFQDVYDWAGRDRTVELAKDESRFCRPEFIDSELRKRFAAIHAENELRGLTPQQFATRAAEHLSELNAIHPFREGNGRAQRAFLEVLASNAGHKVDLTRIEPNTWNDASVRGFIRGDYQPMRQVIEGALTDQGRPSPTQDHTPPRRRGGRGR